MELSQMIAGTVCIELLSADIESSIQAMLENDIPLYEIDPVDELRIRFRIDKRDYEKLVKIQKRKGNKIRIIGQKGLSWVLLPLMRRPVLLLGVLFLVIWMQFLPTRILFVRVEGNHEIPTNRILAAAGDSGIYFGASRREVRSEKVKNALLGALPELQWAGVNTAGCVATITVQERSIHDQVKETSGVSHIVSARDGVIESCTATAGRLMCVPGQAVQKGEILISGYTDCGIYVRAEQAEGEVYAKTAHEMTVFAPLNYAIRGDAGAEVCRVSLIIGKKRINFYKGSGISTVSCDKMYSEYDLTLPGGFILPVKLLIEYSTCYSQTEMTIPEDALTAMVPEFSRGYLESQMIAGSILQQETELNRQSGGILLRGRYVCLEMIGRVQEEQIGERNGSTE